MESIGGSGSAALQLEGLAGMPGTSTQLPLLPIVSLPASAAGAYPQLPLMDLGLPASHSLPSQPGYGALGQRSGCSGGVAACLPSMLVTARHAMSGVRGMSDGECLRGMPLLCPDTFPLACRHAWHERAAAAAGAGPEH